VRQRPLQEHWRVLYLDGVHFSIRHGDQADFTLILTVLGVDLEGKKEVLALRACAEEDKEGWLAVLQDMRRRGATQVDLLVTDGHDQGFSHFERRRVKSERGYSQRASLKRSLSFFMHPPQHLAETLVRLVPIGVSFSQEVPVFKC
jgi:Transposase, Mutator family